MELLHWLSIFIEAIVAILGLKLALNKKVYGWGILTTFSIYVFYDLAKYFSLDISSGFLYFVFFIASVSALLTVWKLTITK